MAQPGDTLLLLDYVGEGTYHAWYADSVYQTSLSAPIEQIQEAQAQWWAQVKEPDGRSGWLWMDQAPPLRGVDACGSPSPREGAAGPEAAVAVIRDYYAAINGKNYRRAYQYWGSDGKASGQTFDTFRSGFAETASVDVETGKPGRVEPAAGSRYVEVSVSITATTTSGQVQHFQGAYTLRRSVVPGGSADERHWRLYSADMDRFEIVQQRRRR